MANTKAQEKSPMQHLLDENMIARVLTGEVWSEDEATIADVRETVGKLLDGLKTVGKAFDTSLVDIRKVQGSDHLPSVKYFRKPRESKDEEGSNPLVDIFSV